MELTAFSKMRVGIAAQTFSRSVAAGLNVFASVGKIDTDAAVTADFIVKMNNLYDIFNSRSLKGDNQWRTGLQCHISKYNI